MIKLVVPGTPIPFKSAFTSKNGSFNPRWREMGIIKQMLLEQYKDQLVDGAVCVDFFFYMPIPKSASKKNRASMLLGTMRPITRPDRDNMSKLYSDCLQGTIICDDSQIVDGRIAKYYSDDPRTEIRIERL